MTLEAGSHIGRIRIDALLGSGGMGEVYRGWDEKLERAVALKVVHSDKRLSAAIRTRFLREARMLSRLDHPNISRIYDVVERDDGDYLVLELVEGRTLRTLLQQPVDRAQALDVALQVARVLTATHARNIIHRDLKPENVMLTPERQVKVLDFGLARSVLDHAHETYEGAEASDDSTKTAVLSELATTNPTHTFAGSIVGTLQYMSPEQARGLPLSEPSDIYSLGVVLLEMLTGSHMIYGPVDEPQELLARVRRAEIAPFDSGDAALDALVKRMLALYPADRPTADDVVRELEAIRTRPARIRRRLVSAGAALAILLAIAGAFFASRQLSRSQALFEANRRGKIAILPFRNDTGDRSLQWIELGLADLVQQGMRRARGVDVVEVARVKSTMENLRLGTRLTAEQRRRLLDALGADVLIAPVVVTNEGRYTIRYAALTPEREESPREATSSTLVEAAKQMSVQLVERVDPASAQTVRERYSLDSLANTLYAIGSQEFRTRGPRVASHYFTLCVDRDPDFIAAKMMLADCHKAMADNERAQELMAEALTRARERRDQEELARGLVLRSNWFVELGDYASAERDGLEALAIARAARDDDHIGAALTSLGYANWRMGKLDRANAQFAEALAIYQRLRDPVPQSRLYNNLGLIAEERGNLAESRRLYETALKIADRIDDRYQAATIVGNLGNVYGSANDFDRAVALTRRQLALCRETGDKTTEIFALTNLGLYLWAQGKEDEAIAWTEEAARVTAKVGNPRVETVILANLATAHTKLGHLDVARRYAAAARAKSAGMNDPQVERDVDIADAYTLIREGKLDQAARALDRAARWQANARIVIYRARLAYARGQYARAFSLIKQAKAMNEVWLVQSEQMYRAFEESARTGKPATAEFESPVKGPERPLAPSSPRPSSPRRSLP